MQSSPAAISETAGFEPEWPHWFHYEFSWKTVPVDHTKEVGVGPVGPGEEPPDVGNQKPCHVVVRAYGDLDGDGIYSTYEDNFPGKGDSPLEITNEAE